MAFRLILTGIILSFGISELYAQPGFKKTRYASEQGLSHNTVLNMTMDDRGFLWIATMDGLNRFDGLEMKVYRPDESDSTSISDGFIHGIHQHKNGKLWISTRDGGINIFDPVTETFSQFSDTTNFPAREVSLLHKDSNGQYWASFFGHSTGVLSKQSNRYYPANIIDKKTKAVKTSANAFMEFRDGSMLMTSFNGLFYLPTREVQKFTNDPNNTQEIEAISVPFSDSQPFPNMVNMKVDSKGELWVNLTTTGLKKMEKSQIPDFLQESINTGVVTNSAGKLVVERDGYLISGYLNNQLLIINLETGRQTYSTLDPGINLQGATYIYEDPNEDLWVYTWGGGFYKLEQRSGITLINNNMIPDSFESDFMLGFEEDKTGFWIGTGAEVAFYDFKTQKVTMLNDRLSNTKINGVWDFERDDLGLWIVTIEDGLVFLNSNSLEIGEKIKAQRFTDRNSIVKSKNLHAVHRDSRGWLWLGYEGEGIQIIKNPEALIADDLLTIEELTTETDNEGWTISTNNIRNFYEDSFGSMWVATNDKGFEQLVIRNNQISSIHSFQHKEGDGSTIPHNDGRSVYQQNDSTYWFATYGGGIAKWNRVTEKITRYTTEDGVPNNSTYSVLGEKEERYIWTSTNSGLARIDTKTKKIDVLVEEDGIQNNEFNTGAYLRLGDGRLVFGGINGLNIINPDELAGNTLVPPVYITEINLFDEPLLSDTSATERSFLQLEHDQNFLSFSFASLDFENPKQNEFAYKMEGVDDDWVYSGNRNYAGYPNLNPGNYTFRVKASNNDGLWNEEGTQLNITITPPWWQTLWFRITTAALLLTGVIVSVRYISQRRLREQIRKMEVENKLRNERERISRDLHDHVGAQLANIMSGLSLADKYNQVDNKEKSSSIMNSLRGDAEVTIKQLRETIWALNQNSLDLEMFKEHLQNYFKNQTAFKESLSINYEIKGASKSALSSTQALNLFRIIQEASQNTLKYAEAKNINIKFHQKNGSLVVNIKDDGSFKGNKSSFNGGYGFGNMKKRAEELNGEVSVETENGTEITVKIPL